MALPATYDLAVAAELAAVQSSLGLLNTSFSRKMRREIAAVISGERNSRFAIYGDSTEVGAGAGTGGTLFSNGARPKSPPSVAARMLTIAGIPARADAWFGNANAGSGTPADYALYNPNVAIGADWSYTSAALGNKLLTTGPTGTSPLVTTPEKTSDRFDVWYAQGSGNGTFTVTDSSGTLATVNSGSPATLGLTKVTVSRAAGSLLPYSIQRTTGSSIFIQGVEPWNSALTELCFLNASVVGWRASDYLGNASPWSPANAIATLAANIGLIQMGANEAFFGVSTATFMANLQSLINIQAAVGGVAIGMPVPGDGGAFDTSAYRSSTLALAQTNSAPVIDFTSCIGSRTADTSIYYDNIHLKSPGYVMTGSLLAEFCRQ